MIFLLYMTVQYEHNICTYYATNVRKNQIYFIPVSKQERKSRKRLVFRHLSKSFIIDYNLCILSIYTFIYGFSQKYVLTWCTLYMTRSLLIYFRHKIEMHHLHHLRTWKLWHKLILYQTQFHDIIDIAQNGQTRTK